MVKPCFSANEDVWVGYGDEIAKFGYFVFDTLEIYIDDFEGFVSLSLHCCCDLRDQSVVTCFILSLYGFHPEQQVVFRVIFTLT